MHGILTLSDGFEALARARARSRAASQQRRVGLRALASLARWTFGLLPVWIGTIWMLSSFVGHGHGAAQIVALVLHAALASAALLLHPGLAHRDRRLATLALGVSTGLALASIAPARAACSFVLPQMVHVPPILFLMVTGELHPPPMFFPMLLWSVGPITLLGLCTWDVARAVRRLGGRAFGWRDRGRILLGVWLALASSSASGVWPLHLAD